MLETKTPLCSIWAKVQSAGALFPSRQRRYDGIKLSGVSIFHFLYLSIILSAAEGSPETGLHDSPLP